MHFAIVVLALALAGSPRVASGPWGGEGAQLVVNAGGASLELDCGRGELIERLSLDEQGRFSVKGTFVREGGPTRRDGGDARAVVYRGRVDGDVLELTACEEDREETIGTWTLTRGREVRLHKCR